MDAIVLAGGVPAPDSALYPDTKGKAKAMLEIGGKYMIQWVLDALDQADTIDSIVIVGCEDCQTEIHSKKIITFKPSTEDIILNFQRRRRRSSATRPRCRIRRCSFFGYTTDHCRGNQLDHQFIAG